MAEKSIIAWTENTFNCVWGCSKVSPGCKNCYADTLSHRYGEDVWGPNKPRREFGDDHWAKPLAWERKAVRENRRIRVFCGSMFDWMEDHPTVNAVRPRLWDLVRRTPHLDWQLLTKRPERIADNLPADWGPWPNVWLGTSIESNDYVWRADHLRKIPAVVRFISYEPALGPLDRLDLTGLDWVLVGGESGPGYRQMDLQWARDLRVRCDAAGCAFFWKQGAAPRTEMHTQLDGETVRNYPTPRRVALPIAGEKTRVISVRGRKPDRLMRDVPGLVYVGRRCMGWPASPFGNPFRVLPNDERRHTIMTICQTAEEAIAKYAAWLAETYARFPATLPPISVLRGKTLGCWCGDWQPGEPEFPCHAIVLAKLADQT